MNPQELLSINIKRIRISRGITQTAISRSANISRQAFVDIESGKTKDPKVSNLQAIADALDVSIVDLFEEPIKLNTVRFRSNSIKNQKEEAKKEQYLIDAAYWLKNFNHLQSIVADKKEYKLKKVIQDAGKIKSDRPKKSAELTRLALKLKVDEPIGDIIGLMENAGIKIKTQSFDLKHFFGFSISELDGGPAIMVNNNFNISIERQIFTVAHELGHLILHPKAYDPVQTEESEQEEKEANIFAGYFLMPDETFKKKLDESYGLGFIDRILHIKRYFGVSYQAVLHRLSDMKLGDYGKLSQKFHAIYKLKYGDNLGSHKEPFPLTKPDFVEDYLVSLVRKALDKAEITVSRAAEILNVSLMNMREIINSWAEISV